MPAVDGRLSSEAGGPGAVSAPMGAVAPGEAGPFGPINLSGVTGLSLGKVGAVSQR